MTHSRTITWDENGITHTLTLPDVGVTALSGWVCRSPIPGTPEWEWVVTNMPTECLVALCTARSVTAVTGMFAGYAESRGEAVLHLRRALRFWESYGYTIDWDYKVAD